MTKTFYQTHFADDGSVYRQGWHITEKQYQSIKDILACESAQGISSWLTMPLERHGRIAFMNLTQRDYLRKFLKPSRFSDFNTFLLID